jgi:DnaJ-domain-containing protein 1
MSWLVLAAFAAFFLWTQRHALPVPNGRLATIAALSVLAMLALRTGRISIALGLGLFALGLAAFWRREAEREPRSAPDMPPPPGAGMGMREAYAVLGLAPGASREDIKQAHRQLMKHAHPDRGGSTHRAARLNEAKDLLLGRG